MCSPDAVTTRQVGGAGPQARSISASDANPPLSPSTSRMLMPETSPVAMAGLASGECIHHARITISEVVAFFTPRGARAGIGCLAGLPQSSLPHAQMPLTDQ